MKKSLIAVLAICSAVFSNAAPKYVDVTITNNTDNISGRPGCKLEFMPSLSSFIEMPAITVNSIMPGGEEKIHLEFADDPNAFPLRFANIEYIARCEGFDSQIEVFIGDRYYFADILSLGNKLSFMGSTGSYVTDKSVEEEITKKYSTYKLTIKQKQ